MRMAWHQEQKADLRIGDYIVEAVDPVVAGSIRHQKRASPLDSNETRWIAARGRVRPACGVCRRQDKEGRTLDEGASMRIDVIEVLLLRKDRRFAIKACQLGRCLDLGHLLLPWRAPFNHDPTSAAIGLTYLGAMPQTPIPPTRRL